MHRLAVAIRAERLAVFPGPFRLAQVRTVCGDERLPAASVGAVLARLVEQSLVQAVDGRFHLLETLRTYAAERLSEPEQLRLRARHARDVADRVGELQWQQRPESEPDCVAALSAMTADLQRIETSVTEEPCMPKVSVVPDPDAFEPHTLTEHGAVKAHGAPDSVAKSNI